MTFLEKIVKNINMKHVYIQTHNFPDPDAIASAFALQMLLERRNISSTICYKGKIDRYSTMKMIEALRINVVNVDDIADMTSDDEVILVDSQKGNANVLDVAGDEVICIDHHPTFESVSYKFSDIRPEVGACASILAQYYFENETAKMPMRLATALVYGIRVDTANLSRGVSKLDLDMLYRLYDLCDKNLVNSLENNTIHCDELQAYASAINSIKLYDDICFANAGDGCSETLIAAVSDFMLALIEVRFSVVYSVRENGIKFSVRNEIPELDAGKITNMALSGFGNGGGHQVMAGGFVPFDDESDYDRDRMDLVIDSIEEKFLNIIHTFC